MSCDSHTSSGLDLLARIYPCPIKSRSCWRSLKPRSCWKKRFLRSCSYKHFLGPFRPIFRTFCWKTLPGSLAAKASENSRRIPKGNSSNPFKPNHWFSGVNLVLGHLVQLLFLKTLRVQWKLAKTSKGTLQGTLMSPWKVAGTWWSSSGMVKKSLPRRYYWRYIHF